MFLGIQIKFIYFNMTKKVKVRKKGTNHNLDFSKSVSLAFL